MSEVEPTDFYIGSFLIQEPVTTLTDVLTASVCIGAFIYLNSMGVKKDKAFAFAKYYLLFMGLGTLFAAFFSHAIVYKTGHNFRTIGWTLTAIGVYCIENAALLYYQREKIGRPLDKFRFVFKVQLILFILALTNPEMRVFELVQVNATLGIAMIALPLFAYLYFKCKKLGYTKLFFALLTTFIPGLVFNFELTLHKYFNYHDIAHVLMAGVSFLIFLGVRQLGEEALAQGFEGQTTDDGRQTARISTNF